MISDYKSEHSLIHLSFGWTTPLNVKEEFQNSCCNWDPRSGEFHQPITMESSAKQRGESDGEFPAHREERLMDNKHDKELRASAENPASDKEKEKRGDDEERALKGCVKMDQRS